MITGFFLGVLQGVFGFLIGLLPVVAFPTQIASAVAQIGYFFNALAFLLPISTIFSVLILAMTFHVTILVWRVIHLAFRYLRGR